MQLPRLVLSLTLLVACGPPSRGDVEGGGDDDPTTDAGSCEEVIDVVFVLDTSSSMDFVLSELETQIGQVVTASNALSADAHFGLIAFQDNHILDNTGALGKVHTSATSLQNAFRNYRDTFTAADRNPGDGPSGRIAQNPICEENSLDALHAATVDFPWRANATRVVILATDDTFLERPDNYGDRDGDGMTNQTNFPSEGNYPAAWSMSETVAGLKDAKIRVFSFSRITQPGIFERCGTGRRLPWSSITDGWSTPYGGQAPIPAQTDGANFNLDYIRSGSMSLSTTINQVVLESFCSPPIL